MGTSPSWLRISYWSIPVPASIPSHFAGRDQGVQQHDRTAPDMYSAPPGVEFLDGGPLYCRRTRGATSIAKSKRQLVNSTPAACDIIRVLWTRDFSRATRVIDGTQYGRYKQLWRQQMAGRDQPPGRFSRQTYIAVRPNEASESIPIGDLAEASPAWQKGQHGTFLQAS